MVLKIYMHSAYINRGRHLGSIVVAHPQLYKKPILYHIMYFCEAVFLAHWICLFHKTFLLSKFISPSVLAKHEVVTPASSVQIVH